MTACTRWRARGNATGDRLPRNFRDFQALGFSNYKYFEMCNRCGLAITYSRFWYVVSWTTSAGKKVGSANHRNQTDSLCLFTFSKISWVTMVTESAFVTFQSEVKASLQTSSCRVDLIQQSSQWMREMSNNAIDLREGQTNGARSRTSGQQSVLVLTPPDPSCCLQE